MYASSVVYRMSKIQALRYWRGLYTVRVVGSSVALVLSPDELLSMFPSGAEKALTPGKTIHFES